MTTPGPATHEPVRKPIPEADPVIVDSGVHVRDSEHARASGIQIGLTFLAVIAILSIFFYGLNNQRTEIAGSETTQTTTAAAASGDTGGTQPQPASQAAKQNAAQQADQQQGKTAGPGNVPATTTGQGANRPAAPPPPTNAQSTPQQPTNAGQSGSPAQPRGAGQ